MEEHEKKGEGEEKGRKNNIFIFFIIIVKNVIYVYE
jgi:hypothetical protein